MAEEAKAEAEVQETGAESQAAEGGDAGGEEKSSSWSDVSEAIGKLGAGEEVELPGHSFPSEEGEEKPTGDETGAAAGEPTDDKEAGTPGKEEEAGETVTSEEEHAEAEAKESEEGKAPPAKNYTIVGADGDEFELEDWPEDAKVQFPADGKTVEATFDELVRHASMGVHAQAKLTELGGERRQAIDYARSLEQELDRSEDILRQVLVDDEAREKVKKAAGKFLDPDYAEGQRAKVELERRDEEGAAGADEEAMAAFWTGVEQKIGEQVSEHEFLEEDDAEHILSEFQSRFERQRDELYARGDKHAEEKGLDPQEVRRALVAHALGWLTEENLAVVMKEENDRIAKRVGPHLKEHGEREATEHNEKTDKKRKRSRGARPLKGGGAPAQPGASGAETELQEGETAWDAAKRRMSRELETARSPLAE